MVFQTTYLTKSHIWLKSLTTSPSCPGRFAQYGTQALSCPLWLGIWHLSNSLAPALSIPPWVFCSIRAEIFEILLKCHVVSGFSIFILSFLLFFIPLRWLTPTDIYKFSSHVTSSRKASFLLFSLVPSPGRLSVSPMLLWSCAYCLELPQVSGYLRAPTWLWLSLGVTVNKDPITFIHVWWQQLTQSTHLICINGIRTDTVYLLVLFILSCFKFWSLESSTSFGKCL